MRRRDFMVLTGGAALAPLGAFAQQPDRIRGIGGLFGSAAEDPESYARMAAFVQELARLGWVGGRNVRIDTRWATTNSDDIRRHAAELAATSSAACLRMSSELVVAQRVSIRTFRPSTQPKRASSCTNAAMRAYDSGSSAAEPNSTPMRRMRSGCCAKAPSGANAAPPVRTMKSRRLMPPLPELRGSPCHHVRMVSLELMPYQTAAASQHPASSETRLWVACGTQ